MVDKIEAYVKSITKCPVIVNRVETKTGFKIEIEFSDSNKIKKLEEANLLQSKYFGFTQNIVGMDFISNNMKFKIVGFKPKNFKYPIIAENESGKQYKFNQSKVKEKLGGDSQINRVANLKKLI